MSSKGKRRGNINPEDGTIPLEEEEEKEEEEVSEFEHDQVAGVGAGPLPGEQGTAVGPGVAPTAESSHPGEGTGEQDDGAAGATGKEGEGFGSVEGSSGGHDTKEGREEAGERASPGLGSNLNNTSEATKRALEEVHQPAVERQKKMRKKLKKCLICLEEDDGLSKRMFQTDCCHLIAHEQCFEAWKKFHSRCFACPRKTMTRRKDNRYLSNTVISNDADVEEDTAEQRRPSGGVKEYYALQVKALDEERAEEERQSLACALDVLAMEAKSNTGEARVRQGAQEGGGGASATGPLPPAFTDEQIAQQAALLAPCDDERIARELEEAERAQAAEAAQQAKKDEDLARELQQRLDEAEAKEKAAADAIARSRQSRPRRKGPGGRSGHGASGGGEGGGSDADSGSDGGAKDRGRLPLGGCRRNVSASLPPALTADGSGGAEMEGVEGTCTGGGGSRPSGSGGDGAPKAASSSSSETKGTQMKQTKRKTQQEEKNKTGKSETEEADGGARRYLDSTGLTSDEESIGDDETKDGDYVDEEEDRGVTRKVRSTPPKHRPRASSASTPTTSTSSPSADACTSSQTVRAASSPGVGGVGGVDVRQGRGARASVSATDGGVCGGDDITPDGAARGAERGSGGGASGGGGGPLVNGNGTLSTASSIGRFPPTVAVSGSAAPSAAGRIASVSSTSARVAANSRHSDLGIDPDQKMEKHEESSRNPGGSGIYRAGSAGGKGGSPEGGVGNANGCEFSTVNGSSQRSQAPDSGSRLKQTKATKPRHGNGGGSDNGGKDGSGSARRSEETGTKRRPEAPVFPLKAIRTKTAPKPGKPGKGGGAGRVGGGSHHPVSGGVSERVMSGSIRKPLVTPGTPPITKKIKPTTTKRCKTGKSGEASSVVDGSLGTCSGGSGRHAYSGGIGRAPMILESTSSSETVEATAKPGKTFKGGGAGSVGGTSRDSGRVAGGERAYSFGGGNSSVTPGYPSNTNTHRIKASRSAKQGKTDKGGEAGILGGGGSSSKPSMTPGFPSSTANADTTWKHGKSVMGGGACTVRGASHDGSKGGSHRGRNRDEEAGTKRSPETLSDETGGGGSGERANRVVARKPRVARGLPSNANEAKIITKQDGGGGGNGSGGDSDDEFSLLPSNRGAAAAAGGKQTNGPGGGSKTSSDVEIDALLDTEGLQVVISDDDAEDDIRILNFSVGGRVENVLPPNRAAAPQVGPVGPEVAAGVAFKPTASEATLARAAKAPSTVAARAASRRRHTMGGKQPKKTKEQGGGADDAGGRGLPASAAAAGGSSGARVTRGERSELSPFDADGAVHGRRQSDQGNSGFIRAPPADMEVFDLTMGDD